jgi:hypothetical protein
VLQAESQSNATGRATVTTARVKLVFRRIIIGFERCEVFRVSAGTSRMADLVRRRFPNLDSTYFTACEPSSAKILCGKRPANRFRGVSALAAHPSNRLDVTRRGRLQGNFRGRSSRGGLVQEPEDSSVGGANPPGWVRAGS